MQFNQAKVFFQNLSQRKTNPKKLSLCITILLNKCIVIKQKGRKNNEAVPRTFILNPASTRELQVNVEREAQVDFCSLTS